MRWTLSFSNYIGKLLIKEWQKHKALELKADQKEILSCIHSLISQDLNREKELELEVNTMLDELEKSHTGQFERYKMFPLLKKKLAKQKGIIL